MAGRGNTALIGELLCMYAQALEEKNPTRLATKVASNPLAVLRRKTFETCEYMGNTRYPSWFTIGC